MSGTLNALFVPFKFHHIVHSISHFIGVSSCMLYDLFITSSWDNYTSRSGWGLGSELLYYVVHFLAITVCSCLYLVNCPYDSPKYAYSTICYDITQLFICYMCMVSFSSPMVIITFTLLRYL